ncbi:hypothetical protein AALO_G00243080 [Alosa alosa]|uniref:ALMS motif domain-containing protein n=2 Tax=Alosa alosa TaxID=278164 RepID=A0AAV6FVV5_9TELE|nr:hypothetical protein AALO_G00243080 [Alosa alosa]
MEPEESPRDGKRINRTMEEWYQLPAEEDSSQLPPQELSQHNASYGQTGRGAWGLHHPNDQSQSLQLDFQDSQLSPALTLLPAKTGKLYASNSTLMQQTDLEFAPLRGSPDFSVLSERLSMMPLVGGATGFGTPAVAHSTTLGHASLSQHPLGEDEGSSCSLSQHSLSPGERHQVTPGREYERDSAEDQGYERRGEGEEEEGEERSAPRGREEDDDDDGSFLNSSVPARTLLELLEKDVGVVSSSSAVSSASETIFSQPELIHKQTDTTHNQSGLSRTRADFADNQTVPVNQQRNSDLFQTGPSVSSLVRSAESAIFRGSSSGGSTEEEPSRNPPGVRECPQGDASASPQPTPAPGTRVDRRSSNRSSSSQLFDTSNLNISGRANRTADISNITFRSSGSRPDASTDALRAQLLSESCAVASRSPHAGPEERSPPELSSRSTRLALQGATGFSIERGHRERILWQSGNQTGVDSSFLTSQPAFQSTPSVVMTAPNRARGVLLAAAGASYSQSPVLPTDTSILPRPRMSDTPPVGAAEASTSQGSRGSLTGGEVGSLPSLSYVQKVDAWRANQSSNRAFSDELKLQGPAEDDQEVDANANASVIAEPAPGNHPYSPFSQPREDSGAEGSAGGEVGPPGGGAAGGGGGGGAAGVVSPPGRSHSHSSSLATVVTSIQHHAAAHSDVTNGPQSARGEESVTREEVGPQGRAEPSSQNGQRSSAIILGHFSDVSSSRDTGHSLSSPQGSFQGEGSVRASFGGASSVMSLEVDNYAPYWTSMPSTPNRERELNIEDRIPVYLKNLGINQSPSTILTPFAPRGPIREPEFSPTDLCTIKGSTGTPTKSTQPSEGESPPDKGEFSRLSQGSSGSLPLSTGRPIMHLSDQDRPPSQGSIRMTRSSSHTPPESPGSSAASLPSLAPTHQMPSGSGQESATAPPLQPPQPREEAPGPQEAQLPQLPQRSPRRDQPQQQQAEDWLVGSRTLQEIRQLLGRAESVLSLKSSLTTSSGSDSSLLQSLRRKMEEPGFTNDSFGSSQLWARSSSDSMLRDSSVSSSEPSRSLGATAQAPADLSCVPGIRETGLKSHAVRRAEPEGCSATDPDRAAPAVLPAAQAPAPTPQEQEEEEEAASSSIGPEEPSPAPSHAGVEQASVSDSSEVSEGSLSARVARLLHEESPVSMVTSRASTTDTDESRAREWILLKASGQRCEALHLNTEDRQRVEEIKRELLQHTKSQYSTDSDGSAPSSVGATSGPAPASSQRTEGFLAVRCAEERLSDQLQRSGRNLLASTRVALGSPPAVSPDLEARVQEIAQREGVPLGPPASSRSLSPLTSITIATARHTPSPSPLPPNVPPQQQQQQAESASVSTQTQTHTLRLQTHTPPPSDTESDGSVSTAEPHLHSALEVYALSQHALSHAHTHADEPGAEEAERQGETNTVETGQVKGQMDEVTGGWGHQSPLAPRHSSTHLRLTLSPKPRPVQNGLDKPHYGMAPVELDQDHAVRSAQTAETLSTNWTDGPSLVAQSFPQEDSIRLPNQEALRNETPTHKVVSTANSPVAEPLRPTPESSVSSQTLSEEQGPIKSQFGATGPASIQISSSSRYPQSFTPPQRLTQPSPRPMSVYAPVPPPTLLPYKPHGSSELFYIPKTDTQLSPNRSDTTVESTHTGSDDAVPPRFTVDILGSRDLEPVPALPKHTEGIYSKKRGFSGYERAGPVGEQGVGVTVTGRRREEEEEEEEVMGERAGEEEFRPLAMEMDFSMHSLRLHTSTLRNLPPAHAPADLHRNQPVAPPHPREREERAHREQTSREIGGSLDQLWQRFSESWSRDQGRSANERETSLLERLERLSRLINSSSLTHGSTIAHSPAKQAVDASVSTQTQAKGQDQPEHARVKAKRAERGKSKKKGRKEKEPGVEERKKGAREESEKRGRAPRLAWAESETQSSSHAPEEEEGEVDEPERLGRCPAERDSISTETSLSTIDTQRLLRAFGPSRVRPPTAGERAPESLLKLYSNIHKQRSAVNESSTVTLDSSSSGSSLPPHPRPSGKRPKVKLVSRGVQAGDLEIVSNGTRRHTRDVGTTFPSPHPTPSSQAQQPALPPQHSFMKERHKKKQPESHPPGPGVSWFVPAEELRLDSRKENRPDNKNIPAAGPTWFEHYSRTQPWREPLRERQNQDGRGREPQREKENQEDRERPQRQQQQQQQQSWVDRDIQALEQREKPAETNNSMDTHSKLSALERLSLQEALAFRRPEFVSRSRERLKRLCLLKEERRLQAQFNLERETLFNRPPLTRRYTHNTAVPDPPVKRAVPKKEMFQRSKQIYSQLPEVRRRKEEEKRKAEYRAYRLNAQLFNKKITNRVLGRRTPWQNWNTSERSTEDYTR